MARRVGFALSMAIGMALTFAAVGAQAESHVRIVRLSYIDGHVQMDRAGGQGLERAILNAPIIEGTRIVTDGSGLAEIEFENRSTLRLADNSEVQFQRLLMNDSGAKVNEIEVVRGIVYLDVQKNDDVYRLVTTAGTFLVRKGTELRLTAEDGQARLAVFKGEVQLEGQAQPVDVKKKQTLTLAAGQTNAPLVTPGVDGIAFDAWNNERAAYASAYTQSASTFGGAPVSGYGLQDLNYYGGFFYAPGYGYAWQPYGLGGMAGWNPYMGGAWMFNQGLGYSFASAYPWGWLPYHYGSWAYLPNAGWAWLPGNGSNFKGNGIVNSFQPTPVISKAPAGFSPVVPPATMAAHNQTVLLGHPAGTTAVIPGGRMPPNFRSVLPATMLQHPVNAKAGAGSTFDAPAATAHSNMAHPASGHVFAPPTAPTAASADPGAFGPSSRGTMGGGTSAGRSSMPTSTAGHSSMGAPAGHPASGHAGGTAQH